jgi:hypothetical protein
MSDERVVNLKSVEREPDPGLVSCLEWLLAKARAGEIDGMFYIATSGELFFDGEHSMSSRDLHLELGIAQTRIALRAIENSSPSDVPDPEQEAKP